MNQVILEMALQAQNCQIQGFYDQAIYLYSEILKQQEDYNILIARAQAFAATNNLEKAISDCESAIFNEHNKFEGYYFRGIYNFQLKKFKPSIIDFKEALQKLDKNHSQADNLACQITIWINKVNAELNNIDFQQFTKDVNVQQLQKEAAILKQMADKAEQERVDNEKKNSGQKEFIWHQTDERVFIEVNQALQAETDLKVTIEEKKLEIYFPIDKVKNIFFDLKIGLFDEVISQESVTKIWLDKVEVVMKKKNKAKNWEKLEDNQSKSIVHLAKQIYPSSSKNKKDWNKIDKELEKETKDDKPGDPFNNFMSTLYQNSSEDVKKAMIKSLQTSGGTVLSTNWDEVKSKDYEGKDRPDAPKGQEWAKQDKWK